MKSNTNLIDNLENIEYGFAKKPGEHYLDKDFTLYDYMTILNDSKTLEDIHKVCLQVQNRYEFEHFGLGVLIPRLNTTSIFIHLFDYINHWHTSYNKNRYFLDNSHHFSFKNVEYINTKEHIQFPWFGENGETGSIRFKFFEHTQKIDIEYFIKILPELLLLNLYIHDAIVNVINKTLNPHTKIKLTSREIEILHWTAHGKSTCKISSILNISESTVISHLKNSYRKLGVKAKHHAIAKAVNLKIIWL